MKKWERFTREELEKFVKDSFSYAQVAEKIGYAPRGGTGTSSVKEMISFYNFDISHFTGQSSNKNNFDYSRFKRGNNIKANQALSAIVYLRGHQCEICGHSIWNGKDIPLEVHHKDGDHLNNDLSNLMLLCPNCHAQTENWRGRNIDKHREEVSEEAYVEALKNSPNIRQALLSLGLSAKGGNYTRARELIYKHNIVHLL